MTTSKPAVFRWITIVRCMLAVVSVVAGVEAFAIGLLTSDCLFNASSFLEIGTLNTSCGEISSLGLNVLKTCGNTSSEDINAIYSESNIVVYGGDDRTMCCASLGIASLLHVPTVYTNCIQEAEMPHSVTLLPSHKATAQAIEKILRHFKWHDVAIIVNNDPFWRDLSTTLYVHLAGLGFVINGPLVLPRFPTHEQIRAALAKIGDLQTGIILVVDDFEIPSIIQQADILSLTASHALFALIPDTYAARPIINSIREVATSSENMAYNNFFVVSASRDPSRDLVTFENISQSIDTSAVGISDAINLACHSYISYTNLSTNFTYYDDFRRSIQNTQFSVSDHTLALDSEGRVLLDYVIYDYNPKTSLFHPVITLKWHRTNENDVLVLDVISSITWYANQPLSHECFLSRETCRSTGLNVIYVILIAASIVVFTAAAIGLYLIIRKYLSKREMEKGPNKILLLAEDIVFIHRKSMSKHSKSHMKSVYLERPDLLRAAEPSFSMTSLNDIVDHSDTARYCGEIVHVKDLHFVGFEMKAKLLSFLKSMRDLRHENINPFLGFLNDANRPAVITDFCTRGSLEDVIRNEDIKLDWDFKLSLLTDLIRGLRYLHSSTLRHHGRLKSRNCVIDSRWVLKMTDYGILGVYERMREEIKEQPPDLLWSAPELLRDPVLMQKGTDKGDVYSLAIVMQEVVLRTPPYSTTGLTPEEIIAKVRKPPPLIRPSVSKQAAPPEYIQLMKQCWAEMPDMRPDIESVYQQYKALNHGKKMNIVDTMFKMLEKYSNDLEEIVQDRTMLLEEEKKKTDQLLFRMLPATVAENLKLGKPIQAESFAEVTIYFSDVVGFTTISAMSTPMEVVDLLNDLYTMFDATIDVYDVYKVETIGDAYMVVSGLPVPNGNRHAGEIGTMALDLLSQCGTFTIRHMPQVPLRLRIGLHTGSCVAGVVGLTMPRYCLFGDTVNTASRMESTGTAFRIHISEKTKTKLDELSGYRIELRGDVELKGKGIFRTYWLVGKDGFDKPLPDAPEYVGLDALIGGAIKEQNKDALVNEQHKDLDDETTRAKTSLSEIVVAITSLKRAVHTAAEAKSMETQSERLRRKTKQHDGSRSIIARKGKVTGECFGGRNCVVIEGVSGKTDKDSLDSKSLPSVNEV